MQQILGKRSSGSGMDRASVHHAFTFVFACVCQPDFGDAMSTILMYGSCKPYQSQRL